MSNNNGIASLVSLGVNMQDDGTLSVDSGKLESALASNYSAVQNFFQSTTSARILTNLKCNSQGNA